MPRVIHFEIHAENPERAVAFYRGLFGWEITNWGGPVEYWVIKTVEQGTPGIDGGLRRRRDPAPIGGGLVNAYVCTVGISDVDADPQKAGELGGMVVVPKMPIPGI